MIFMLKILLIQRVQPHIQMANVHTYQKISRSNVVHTQVIKYEHAVMTKMARKAYI